MVKADELDDARIVHEGTPKISLLQTICQVQGMSGFAGRRLVDIRLTFHNPCLPSVRPVSSEARFHSRFQIDEARSNDEIRHRSGESFSFAR